MVDLALGQFVHEAVAVDSARWDEQSVRTLAAKVAPAALGGSANWLLLGDINSLWARWFLEGVADPQPYLDGRQKYAHLFKQVNEAIEGLATKLPSDERAALTRSLARLLWREVERRNIGRRIRADRELRLWLWELYPRCWICGAAFTDWARQTFLRDELSSEPTTLKFIDFYKSRGTRLQDLRVEIEHVVPHAGGGRDEAENLRLACGWCNRAKSDRTLLYDAEGTPRRRSHPTLGVVTVPQPFWIVRFLAMRGRCEDPSGCTARTSTEELTVAPRTAGGAPNPSNLVVVCRQHDPLADVRLVAARYAGA